MQVRYVIDRYGYLFCFCLLFLFLFHLLLVWHCLLPVDSSMSLSVTECNWFCQGQSIAPFRLVVLVTEGVSPSNSIVLTQKSTQPL